MVDSLDIDLTKAAALVEASSVAMVRMGSTLKPWVVALECLLLDEATDLTILDQDRDKDEVQDWITLNGSAQNARTSIYRFTVSSLLVGCGVTHSSASGHV